VSDRANLTCQKKKIAPSKRQVCVKSVRINSPLRFDGAQDDGTAPALERCALLVRRTARRLNGTCGNVE
jgi:hypothetical protein